MGVSLLSAFENEIAYKLKQFISSTEKGYASALRIYTNCVPREAKTSTNEITYWLDSSKRQSETEFMFFGFYSNDTVIGYAEIAYIKQERLIVLDYMVIDAKYMSNSSFSTFFFLLLGYFEKNDIDYDYIVTEILVKFNDAETEGDHIRLFENEDFKVIHALYIQPRLEISNSESNKEALLMIYQRGGIKTSIQKESYFRIVRSIYFDHYHTWDNAFYANEEERNDSYNKLLSDLEKIKTATNEEVLSNEEVRLNGYKNKLVNNNTLPPTSSAKIIRNSLIFTLSSVILIMLILLFLQELNMELRTVMVVTITILFILFSFIYLADKRSAKILEKLPFLSSILKAFDK